MKKDALIGKFYHTFQDGVLEQQGEILSCVAPGLYLVQTFEWLFGSPFDQRIEPVSNMVGWTLYSDHEDMQRAWERYNRQRRGQ
jgi:hypothetical protein